MLIGVAQRPASGEVQCGDAYVIVRRGPRTLVALADGLGHGPEAAWAARTFCSHAEAAADAPLDAILASGDRAVAGTRGVAASLLRLDPPGHAEFAGVGNVVLRVLGRAPAHPLSVPGILGRRNARKLRCERFAVERGDLLVLFTDGVSGRWEADGLGAAPADEVARALLDRHGRSHDDATCVVVRWGAPRPADGTGGWVAR